MIALYIFAGFFLLFLLSLWMKITVCVSYINDLQVRVKLLFFKIRVYPFKEEEREEQAEPKKKRHLKQKKQKPPKENPSLKDTILLIKELLIEIIDKFGRYIRLEEYRMKVLVATDDPAKTGVLYGVVCGALASISVFIDQLKNRTHKKNEIFTEVTPDFIADEPELSVSVALSLRVWQLLSMGITASKSLLKYNSLRKEASDSEMKKV